MRATWPRPAQAASCLITPLDDSLDFPISLPHYPDKLSRSQDLEKGPPWQEQEHPRVPQAERGTGPAGHHA